MGGDEPAAIRYKTLNMINLNVDPSPIRVKFGHGPYTNLLTTHQGPTQAHLYIIKTQPICLLMT